MSSCYLVEFYNNKASPEMKEYKNAWWGEPRIWDALHKTYGEQNTEPYSHSYSVTYALPEESFHKFTQQFFKRNDVEDYEKAVLAFTMGGAIVYNKNFKQFAEDLDEFVAKHPVENQNDHLPAWAEFFRQSNAEAIGLHGTDVVENRWITYTENEEIIPYDLNDGNDHDEVYEWLESGEPLNCDV